jgi:hypothetical protein
VSAARRKGTAAESAVVGWLREHGWPFAERRALAGAKDRGDIAGLPGVVLEVKNAKQMQLGAWLAEMLVEVENDGADLGWLVVKKRGTTNPADWYWVTTGRFAAQLMKESGR